MEIIDGVLIEGVDYVGKTTVSRRLAELIGEIGWRVSLGQCYLERTPLIEFLEREAKKSDDMITRDFYYTAALVSDLSMFARPDDYRVQDRHWLTQLGRNTFFRRAGEQIVPVRHFMDAHRPFARNVLLTSSVTAKAERAAGRPVNSPRDRYLLAHPDVHQDYEEYLQTLLPTTEDWLILDTTAWSVDEVAHQILAYCSQPSALGVS